MGYDRESDGITLRKNDEINILLNPKAFSVYIFNEQEMNLKSMLSEENYKDYIKKIHSQRIAVYHELVHTRNMNIKFQKYSNFKEYNIFFQQAYHLWDEYFAFLKSGQAFKVLPDTAMVEIEEIINTMPKDYRDSEIGESINKEVWDEVYRIVYRLLEVFANIDNTEDTVYRESINQIMQKSLLKDYYDQLWCNLREINEFPMISEIEKIKEIYFGIYDMYKKILV